MTVQANEAGHAPDTSTGAGDAGHSPAPQETPPSAVDSAPAAEPEPESEAAPPTPPATREPSIDELLSNPAVQAEMNKRAKLAARRAMEEAEEAARHEAELAAMEETERLQYEKELAEARVQEMEEAAALAEMERDLVSTLVTRDVKLVDDSALEFLRHQAYTLIADDDDLPMAEAVDRVLERHKYLVRTPQADAGMPASPPQRPSTAPSRKDTAAPAAPVPKTGVDVSKMSRAEYEEYKRSVHGLV